MTNKIAKALRAVAPLIRREHDRGGGLFSTAEVEAVEAAIPFAKAVPGVVEALRRAVARDVCYCPVVSEQCVICKGRKALAAYDAADKETTR